MVPVIFMGLGGATRWRVKSYHMEVANHKGRTIFYRGRGVDPSRPLDTMS